MRVFKKVFFTLMIAVFSVAILSSCRKSTSVPYGSISNEVYASSGDYSITEKELYDSIRSKNYNKIYSEIKNALVADEIAEVDYANNADDKIYIDELVLSACYNAVSAKALEDLTSDEIALQKAKYIDTMSQKGITVTADELTFEINDEQAAFSSLGLDLINYYVPERAYWIASKSYLDSVVDTETLKNVEGDDVDNKYYINETKLKEKYNNSYKNYGTTRAIIIRFNSLRDANMACNAINTSVGALSEANAVDYFIALYNYYYSYRTQLTTSNIYSSDETLYRTDKDHTELADLGSNFRTFYTNTLEDGDYTAIPRALDNNRYTMVMRLSTEYINGTDHIVDFEDLDSLGTAKKDEILAEVKESLIESYISTSFYDVMFESRMRDAEVQIYDPVFEAQFYKTYGEDYYDLVKKSSKDTVFTVKYNNVTTTLLVDDFYADVESYGGVALALDKMMYDYCISNYSDKISDDDLDTYKSELNSAISKFKGNNATYDKSIGLETYLTISYGYSTKDDVLKYYYKAPACLQYYIKTYFEDSYFNDDHTINVNNTVFQNFLIYTAKVYESLFTINLDHILISVDDNCDGTLDDPVAFRESLSGANQTEFDAAVLDLTKAIVSEAECMNGTDLLSASNYIKKAFNQGDALVSTGYVGKTWNDYKSKFNFVLTVESLGEVTQATSKQFVDSFQDYIKDVYADMVDNDITQTTDDDAIFYYVDSNDNASIDLNEICTTEYGYHILIVNEIDTPTAPTFLSNDDLDGEYSEIKVTVDSGDDVDDESDDIYFVTDAYNTSTTNASINQLFIYFYEHTNGGVVSLPSNLSSSLSEIFDGVLGYYIDTDFRKYLAELEVGTITWADSNNAQKYDSLMAIKKRNLYDYKEIDTMSGWYNLNWLS